ncbi:MAG: AraC family transcriptional regulator [Clostridia bacterium]|nr:AraC family transcriptional regulator [Clostridia bacterium]
MPVFVNKTDDGTRVYPMHKHKFYEIMLYIWGEGFLRTAEKSYPFEPGTIIIVPPEIPHGSISEKGFVNISVGCDFEKLLYLKEVCALSDNDSGDGKKLAQLIYENRYFSNDYLRSLCSAYIRFILQNMERESSVALAVERINRGISESACDPDFCVTDLLCKSGYAEDYIRACFKKITGMTPGKLLCKVRIDRACYLMSIYSDTLPLCEIAERCGFTDYVYFTKKFKEITGKTPSEYRKEQ